MKRLAPRDLDVRLCREGVEALRALLPSRKGGTLGERADILPLFRQYPDLSLLVGTYHPHIDTPNAYAHEYVLFGDFVVDLSVGDTAARHYLLVEFEEAGPESLFVQRKTKITPDWSRVYERAFSQVVDWLWKANDMRSTGDFEDQFGHQDASFHALIVAGRQTEIAKREEARLRWRTDHVVVNSHKISSVNLDTLCADLDYRLWHFWGE